MQLIVTKLQTQTQGCQIFLKLWRQTLAKSSPKSANFHSKVVSWIRKVAQK